MTVTGIKASTDPGRDTPTTDLNMYTIWVLALFLGVVSADIGLGYQYKVPQTSYGVPSYQIGGSRYSNAFSGGSSSGTGTLGSGAVFSGTSQGSDYSAGGSNAGFVGSSNSAFASTSGTGIGSNYNTQGTTGGSGFNYNAQGSGYNGAGTSSANQGAYQGVFGQNTQSGYYQTGEASYTGSQPSQSSGSGNYNQFQTSNQYQTTGDNKYQEYYNQIVHQPPQVFKHFYVHAAPEEPELPKPRQPLVLPPPQKHYKIIFIQTPVQPAAAPQLIPVPQQNEEKTLVYVLVKKPEDAQNIVLPKFEQKAPEKPEVFFIKYNDKHDSQSIINNVVSDYNKGGVSSSFSGSGTEYSTEIKNAESSSSNGITSGVSTMSGFGSTTGGSGISEGSSAVSSISSGNAFGGASAETVNQGSDPRIPHVTLFGPTGTKKSGGNSNSFSSGLESIFGTPGTLVASSTASSESLGYDTSAISTSQGVPHESYGLPKFKEY